MRAEARLFTAIFAVDGVMAGEDPYISADDKVELERIRNEIHRIRNAAISRQEDDEQFRNRVRKNS